MNNYLFPLLYLFALHLCDHRLAAEPTHCCKIESLEQLPEDASVDTVYFFDLDDTLFDTPYMLGSRAWRKYIAEATKDDPTHNWHDIFSLFIAQHYPVQPVEAITSEYVRALQEKGHTVYGLTARERNIWYNSQVEGVDLLTVCQLESVGIDLSRNSSDPMTMAPEYFKGIFFADLEPKGAYLLKLLSNCAHLPQKIIFIDDKQSQVESVAAVLEELGIEYACYWYVATDQKAVKFDPLIANIQLFYFWASQGQVMLSDENASSLAALFPDRDASYYLQEILPTRQNNLQCDTF